MPDTSYTFVNGVLTLTGDTHPGAFKDTFQVNLLTLSGVKWVQLVVTWVNDAGVTMGSDSSFMVPLDQVKSIQANLKEGHDYFTNAAPVPCTVYGDNGNDAILGIGEFWGGNGNDRIEGSHITADKLYGGPGNDTLKGHNGDDSLYGGNGNDSIEAGNGNDVVAGEAGKDKILGLNGDDTLDGGTEGDTLFGGEGKDCIEGGNGNDSLLGQNGDDTLSGGNGNDTLAGGNGTDTVIGGVGNDIEVLP